MYRDFSDRLYVPNPESWVEKGGKSLFLDGKLEVRKYSNAVVLPLVKRDDIATPDGVFSGGVCESDYSYVAGHKRKLDNNKANYSCETSYIPSEEPLFRDESVVFGGILFKHFGHMLLEGMTRLWYVIKKRPINKIVFLIYPNETDQTDRLKEFFSLLDINEKQIEIIEQPTRFKEIVVPDESAITLSGYFGDHITVYDYMKNNVEPSPYKKVYFSRTKFSDNAGNNGFINEQYYEEFFSRRGFKIIHPEQFTLREQISFVAGAEKLVSPLGTMTHLLLFANPSIEATILVRSTSWIEAQFMIDQVRQIKTNYVYAVRNILPCVHTSNAFLFAPNRFFRRYLDDSGIIYEDKELELSEEFPKHCYEYLLAYDVSMRDESARKKIENKSMGDVLRSLHSSLFQEEFPEDVYESMNLYLKMKREKERAKNLEKKVKHLEQEIRKIKSSKSWKITKPLRAITRLFNR